MAEISSASLAELRKLLDAERQLLAQFLHITKEQENLLAEGNEDDLPKSLEQRQQIINRVEELLPGIAPLWQEYSASTAKVPELTALQEEIGRILDQATEIDKKNRLAVGERMELLREQMRRASETRRGAEAYIKGAELFSAEYVDKRQ